jgi:hypothetical protein
MWRVREESVSMERLDGETILINFDTGQYFSFQGSSADVLWLVQSGVDATYWPEVLQDAFPGLQWDETVETEVRSFLNGLVEVGVIEATTESGGPGDPLPEDYLRGAWSAPSVFANDDLADLLVIDPIHDTSEDGWPQSRPS